VAFPDALAPSRRAVRALSRAPPSGTPADGGDGGTVAAQYETALGRALNFPGLPCVDVAVGAGAAPEWVPAELCRCAPGGGEWGCRISEPACRLPPGLGRAGYGRGNDAADGGVGQPARAVP
jgi:hypothetical protein